MPRMADPHIEEHASFIKTPKQLAAVVLAGFLAPVVGIVLLIELITGGLKVDADAPAMSEEAVAQRLKPVGEVVIGAAVATAPSPGAAAAQPAPTVAAPAPPTGANRGEQVYRAACQACHATGVAGAPKLGDQAAWKPRIAQGIGTLHEHAIQGIRMMPPKGGAMSTPDADIKAAVDYMVARSK
jgi:cytochrome c5